MRKEFAGDLLGLIEQTESRLLSWGFYDVGFSEHDIEDLIEREAATELRDRWHQLKNAGTSLPRLLSDMQQAGLLFQPVDNPALLRTRFAETVRLLARLRQMFRIQGWATAPRLVRDIKIHLRPRKYPKRDNPSSAVQRALEEGVALSARQKSAFQGLSQDAEGDAIPYAGFQARAFERILCDYGKRPGFRGTVICAGTGSGKTKAFYVPAILGIVEDIARSPRPFTKVIAIYPRNVLLADQLRELVAETQKLTSVLSQQGLRPITVGALLGDTPPANQFDQPNSLFLKNWERVGNGWVVPFIKSTIDSKSALVWRDADRLAGRTCLYRKGAPSGEVPVVADNVLSLTRDNLQATPPDVLFVSLEMLNQEIGSPQWARTFGIDHKGNPPRLLLLDEVHSYAGLAGAQLPWIIRRWMLAAKLTSLHVVGLSATLADAGGHLANVSGVPAASIREIRPIEDPDPERSELLSEGIEYNLAVRGSSTAGASLLATSIQAAMLLGRVLTSDAVLQRERDDRIQGVDFFARKVFGFTDNLDTLNRWLADLVNADNQLRLAALRASTANPSPAAFRDGQIWRLSELLGHDLQQSIRIDRCSSQEPGVDPNARVVLATSSLEVGYDDPEVGVILQHKAPSSKASFIQRKGRAGRRRGTRPMTVVMLSDFGRDRWAYRDSHRLFDDSIERQRLPALNPYVLKIQAARLLLDWLGRSLGRPDLRRELLRPEGRETRTRAIRLLEECLNGGAAWDRLYGELRTWLEPYVQAVRPGSDVSRYLDAVVWSPPRPLLRHVIPALLKQLQGPIPQDPVARRKWRPIPEYIPERTFSNIDSRDIRVNFVNDADRTESLDASRFLNEFCPGRVSKRYSINRGEVGYWPIASAALNGAPDLTIDVATIASDRTLVRELDGIAIYQPHSAELAERPRNVKDSSQGSWRRLFTVEPVGGGTDVPLLRYGIWRRVFTRRRAHLHRDNDGLRVLRYATDAAYETVLDGDVVIRGQFHLMDTAPDEGTTGRQAIGFLRTSDGLVLDVDPAHLEAVPNLPESLVQRFRVDYFLQSLLDSAQLRVRANTFAISYLAQTSLAMLSATALRQKCSLQQAQQLLRGRRARAADEVIGRLLGGVDDDERQQGAGPTRRHQQILNLWNDPDVEGIVAAAEATLWAPIDQSVRPWLVRRYVHTLAAGLRAAISSLLPDVPDDDLAVDVFVNDGATSIVISESTSGGVGHLEAFLALLANDPGQVDVAMRASLVQCSRARAAETLLETVALSRRGPHSQLLSDAFETVRSARTFRGVEASKTVLIDEMRNAGLDCGRESVLALMSSVLRPGSSPETDRWFNGLNALWRSRSTNLGVAIPAAVFSYWCSRTGTIDRRFRQSLARLGGIPPTDQQVFLALESQLHEGCHDSCAECLETGEPDDLGTKPSRSLALHWAGLSQDEVPLQFGTKDWLAQARASLRDSAQVTISADAEEYRECVAQMIDLAVAPIEAEFLMVNAALAEVRRRGRQWIFVWRVRGLANAS